MENSVTLRSTPCLLMAINFINRLLYTVHRKTVGGAQLQEIIESSTHHKYFVRDVI